LLNHNPSPNGEMDWDVRVDQARIVQTLKLKKAAIRSSERR
jgi:hypothetical protein